MRRWVQRQGLALGFLFASAVLAGCDSDSFVPPPKAGKKVSTAISPSAPQSSKEIVLILPAEDNPDLQLYEAVCRLEAGVTKVIFNTKRPSPGDPKSKQGELIKEAVAEGASALIVVPDATNETAIALAAVDQKKTPIVLLGRSIESPASGPPYTLVTFSNFAANAKKLVEALAEDAKRDGAAPGAPVLFLKDATADESSAERDAAITEALKAAKMPIAKTLLTTENATDSQKIVEAALKDDPKICAVIADDDSGLSLGGPIRREIKARTTFPVGGYATPRPGGVNTIALGQTTVIAERNVGGLVSKAMQAAVQRSEGKTVPDRIEVDLPIRRAKPAPAAGTGPAVPPGPTSKDATKGP